MSLPVSTRVEIVESVQFLRVGKNPIEVMRFHSVDSSLGMQLQEVLGMSLSSITGSNTFATPGSPLATAHIHDVLMQK